MLRPQAKWSAAPAATESVGVTEVSDVAAKAAEKSTDPLAQNDKFPAKS